MIPLRGFVRLFMLVAIVSAASPVFADEPYQGRLFDVHVHYSHEVWNELDAKAALRLLEKAEVTGALASSTPDEGTRRLMREKQSRVQIVPFYRPHKESIDVGSWFKKLDRLDSAKRSYARLSATN